MAFIRKFIFHLKKKLYNYSRYPGICILLFFVAFYYFTNAADFKGGDEFYIRSLAKSFVRTGTFGINLGEKFVSEECCVKKSEGLYYIKWGVGQALIEAPFYVFYNFVKSIYDEKKTENISSLYEVLILNLCPSIVSAIGCSLVYLIGITFGFSKRKSIFICLLYGAGTISWPYSKSLMSDTTLNVAILGAIYGAISYNRTSRSYFIFVSGLCMGFALITKITSAVIVPFLLLYLILSAKTRKSILNIFFIFLPVFAFFIGVELHYNFLRYGDFFQFGYGYGRDQLFGFSTPITLGVMGLLISPGKSIFLYTPIAILSLFSAKQFYQEHKKEALLFLVVIILFILLHARWWAWSGDWAWGPRFLVVITPYMLIPIGYWFARWNGFSLWIKNLIYILIAFSIFVQVLGISIHPFSFIITRTHLIKKLVSPKYQNLNQYAWVHNENILSNFSPLFSHIAGNWWLFKHMLFSYDIWSDAPWKILGVNINLPPPYWFDESRIVPFWWPFVLPQVYPSHRYFILFLVGSNLFLIGLFGFWLTYILKINKPQ